MITALIEHLEKIKESFVVGDLKAPFTDYVRKTLSPALHRFGKERAEGEEDAVSVLRPELLRWLGLEGQAKELR